MIEADEFDRSFHHLTPTVAVITATDPDHLDIYGTEEAYLESFAQFTELIRPDGALIIHENLKLKPARRRESESTPTRVTAVTSTPAMCAAPTAPSPSTSSPPAASSATSISECSGGQH